MTEPDLSDTDYLHAAYADAIAEGIPLDRLIELYTDAETAPQFFAGVQALVELQDIVEDHYAKT